MKDRKHLWGKTSVWSPPPGILRKSNRTVNKVMSTHTRISLWVKVRGGERNINLPFRFGFFGETEEGGGGKGGERRLLRAKGKRHAAKTNYDAKKEGRRGGCLINLNSKQ